MVAFRALRTLAVLAVLGAMPARAGATDWSPPIGIPSPSFGIFETAPASPSPWTAETPGFYYVDATKSGSTDANNPYGSPARPRRTIPTVLPAGAVVELHGTYDTAHSSPATIVAQGTRAAPVFIRGVSAASRPLVRRFWEVKGTFLIIENIEFGPMPDRSSTGSMVIRLPASHVALRHSDLHGTPSGGGLGIVNWEVGYGEIYRGSGVVEHVVIFDNTIHDNGDVNAKDDQDVHGISVTDHVNHLWVVDNQLYRNSGDGIQIVAPGRGQRATTHHIYVGRNVSHHNKQTGFWVKQATDVIFSQNVSYGHRPGNSSMGQCMGGQYAPDWVWFLYNRLSDCEYGVALMSDDGERSRTFIIGNVIHNIHRTISKNEANDAWGPAAIMMAGGYERHVVNNTIYDVDSGVNIATPVGSLEVADNIIANVTQARASHVLLGFDVLAANTTVHHDLLFGNPRLEMGGGQVHLNESQLATLRSIGDDPQFVDAARGDFHIARTSPAANSGELNGVYGTFEQRYGISIAVDADGNARPLMATSDIGAYLANGTAGSALPSPAPPAAEPVGVPGAPSGLRAVISGSTLTLSWNRPTTGGTPSGFIIEMGSAPGVKDIEGTFPAGTTTVTGAIPRQTSYFRVRAVSVAGTSDPSNEVIVTVK